MFWLTVLINTFYNLIFVKFYFIYRPFISMQFFRKLQPVLGGKQKVLVLWSLPWRASQTHCVPSLERPYGLHLFLSFSSSLRACSKAMPLLPHKRAHTHVLCLSTVAWENLGLNATDKSLLCCWLKLHCVPQIRSYPAAPLHPLLRMPDVALNFSVGPAVSSDWL